MAGILSGRELARIVESEASERLARWESDPPGLAVVLIGDDPASRSYVRSKEKACARTGIRSLLIELPGSASEDETLSRIEALNLEDSIDAVLCQLPLPSWISPSRVASAIDPLKDVDGFHPLNVGRLWRGEDCLAPCTPAGIMRLFSHYGIGIEGKRAIIIGRSIIVGKPMAAMLLSANATVVMAHSRTPDLPALCRSADILVSAVGSPGLVRGDWVKEGAVVIDVGTSSIDGRLRGDVLFEEAEPVASFVTPVPGGVGPLTIAMLMMNTVRCRELRSSRRGGVTS